MPNRTLEVKGRIRTDNDGSGRKTEIMVLTVLDGQLMLQVVENGKAWTW